MIGIDPVRQVFEECIAARPCVMSREEDHEFRCPTHGTLFLPALLRSSPLWKRIREGLKLFGVPRTTWRSRRSAWTWCSARGSRRS